MLLPLHLDDLRRSGLSGETISVLGFYSGSAQEVKAILGFSAGPGLVLPYPQRGNGPAFVRVKPTRLL